MSFCSNLYRLISFFASLVLHPLALHLSAGILLAGVVVFEQQFQADDGRMYLPVLAYDGFEFNVAVLTQKLSFYALLVRMFRNSCVENDRDSEIQQTRILLS